MVEMQKFHLLKPGKHLNKAIFFFFYNQAIFFSKANGRKTFLQSEVQLISLTY